MRRPSEAATSEGAPLRHPLPQGLRTAIALAVMIWIVASPAAEQVFGLPSPWLRSWRMYAGSSLDICRARYAWHGPEGSEPIDRYALLGYGSRWEAPESLRAIRDERAARGIGKALCAHFGADADVRGFVECATHEGWEEVVRGQANLCESAAPEWTDGATVPEEEP